MPLLIDAVGVFLALCLTFIAFYKWRFQYWKRRNIPYLEPSIPFGNLENPSFKTKSIGVRMAEMYKEIRARNLKHCGIFTMAMPMYYVTDLEYIKNIMVKDFQHFVDRGTYYNEKDDPIGAHLFAIGGVKWRNLRTKLTPTFTSGKMKMMFQTLVDCSKILEEVMETKIKSADSLDIKEILGCFTTDIIGSCAFGLECDSFKDEESAFRKYSRKVLIMGKLRTLLVSIAFNFPDIGRALHIRQVQKDVSDFFYKVVTDTVNYRENNNIVRKDFLQLLINIKNNKEGMENGYQHDGNTLTMDEVVAQSFIFFLAGFETSSTTMTFALFELAKNADIQEKVREEINNVLGKYNGEITYDSINDMKYMNQVIDETLRKYPPVPFLTRVCVKDYKIPDEDIVIEKGVKLIIPILGLHYDEKYYPDPETFDPERFNEENKKNRHPFAHIPFGEGPRICIGMRFGLMQSKVGLTALLRKYRFSINKKTQLPLKMNPATFIPTADGGIWLDFQRI